MKLAVPQPSLVVLIGASGSGKTTFARRHFLPTEILSSDACRAMVSDDENNMVANGSRSQENSREDGILSGVVSLSGVAALTGQGQGADAARQAWEYKTLVFNVQRGTSLYEDGKQLSGSETPISRAPELGAQGWELVSVAALVVPTVPPTSQYVYWFKRPK
jgi:hypothetical protein